MVPESMSWWWCLAMAMDHTFMAPIANPMPARETNSSNTAGVASRRARAASWPSNCSGRRRRDGGARATAAVPAKPREAVTASATAGLYAEASAAKSRGPRLYSRPCVPVSNASARAAAGGGGQHARPQRPQPGLQGWRGQVRSKG